MKIKKTKKAFVASEWEEINKTRTEKVTQKKFIKISKVWPIFAAHDVDISKPQLIFYSEIFRVWEENGTKCQKL